MKYCVAVLFVGLAWLWTLAVADAPAGKSPAAADAKAASKPAASAPAAGAPAAAVVAAPALDKSLVLDNSGYFRIYYEMGMIRISSAALKAEGEAMFGDRIKQLQRETLTHLKNRKVQLPESADWRDYACAHFCRTQQGDDTRAAELIPIVPPPAQWEAPDFDDGQWLRQRLGRLPRTRPMKESYEMATLLARRICYRTYFNVDDPAAVNDLRLDLAYRGGARVLVNGEEVASGHLLPATDASYGVVKTPGTGTNFAEDAKLVPVPLAEPYPRDAYISLDGETPPQKRGIVGEIRGGFDDAAETHNPAYREGRKDTASRQPLNRAGWDRLMALRDRKLGPIVIPAKLLRRGANVLAVEIVGSQFHPQIYPGAGGPQTQNWTVGGGTENWTWDHARLLNIELRSGSSGVAKAIGRPAGVQVWAADMHDRLFSPDYNPPGWSAGAVRIVGANNGTFAGMLVLGTDKELTAPKAVVSDLKGEAGSIPASAVTAGFMVGHSVNEMGRLGSERCLGNWGIPAMGDTAISRYEIYRTISPDPKTRQQAMAKALEEFKFFDHIGSAAPEKVPADTCQPVWLSVKVPADAPTGKYRGTVTLSAEGMSPASLPVELEVIVFRVPNPSEFQMVVESEQSPYGIAKAFSPPPKKPGTGTDFAKGKDAKSEPVPFLWSDEHWRLMDASFRQLARVGAKWVFVPVLANSEFGNREDCSIIKWTHKADGTLAFDYTIMDRYLDLAVKHLGKPKVVSFDIMHGCGSSTNAVNIFNEAGGQEMLDVGPAVPMEKRRPIWQAFATSLVEHIRAKGLADVMYWGHAFDRVYDPELVALMRQLTPGIYWSAGAHARQPDDTFRAVARAYGSDILDHSLMGWKNPYIHLLMPRTNGSVICVEGTSTPFTYRVMCDRAVYCGFNGIGRMGADYFDQSWFDGFRGGEYLLVGRSCVQTLWPGKSAAGNTIDSSARNEAMLEGLQEAEARIFLEQAVERKAIPDALSAEVTAVLDDHFRQTLYIPGGTASAYMMEYTGDWQGRSRRLYATAARVAAAVGVDVDRTQVGSSSLQTTFYGQTRTAKSGEGVPVPAMGQASVNLRLRNWAGVARSWKVSTTQPWIKPARSQGTLTGQEDLAVVLDASAMPDGSGGGAVTGVLTVSDAAGGKSYPVEISARIVKPLEFNPGACVFNVADKEAREFPITNRSGVEQSWRLVSTAEWLKAEPPTGKIAPGGSVMVKLIASVEEGRSGVKTPGTGTDFANGNDAKSEPVLQGGPHSSKLTFIAADGKISQETPVTMFVVPAYQPPKPPTGREVFLEDARDLLVSHRCSGPGFYAGGDKQWFGEIGTDQKKRITIVKKVYTHGLWATPRHESVYKLAGSGITGFSAEVGLHPETLGRAGGAGIRINFEIWVDGKVKAQSGLMRASDDARLIAVDGLAGAKELRLITRTETNVDNFEVPLCNWADAKFFKP